MTPSLGASSQIGHRPAESGLSLVETTTVYTAEEPGYSLISTMIEIESKERKP